MGYQELNEAKPHVISLLDFPAVFKADPTNDRALVKRCAEILGEADYLITWYGIGFDERFLATRLLYYKLPPLPPILDIDGWVTAKFRLAMHSNRLQAMQEFLELKSKKTAIDYTAWRRAPSGHIPSIRKVIHHCRCDIDVLLETYLRLRPYLKDAPNMAILTGKKGQCGRCLSPKLQRRGLMVTRSRAYQRYQCQACGAWSRGSQVTVQACAPTP